MLWKARDMSRVDTVYHLLNSVCSTAPGAIPPELGQLRALDHLMLMGNNLSGKFVGETS